MKVQFVVQFLLSGTLLLSSASIQAQSFPRDPRLPETAFGGMEPVNTHPVALSGRVSVEGGADILKDTVVVLDCGYGDRVRANVDPRGRFVLMLDNGSSSAAAWGGNRASAGLSGCSLRAEAIGYQSSVLNLQGYQSGVVEVGTIVISRVNQQGEEFMVSAVSLAAPEKAKKDFAKGKNQAKKGRWAAACDSFRKAIQAYPRYAIAWLELGRAQLHQNNINDAQQSFVSATTQDSKLLPAYVELAHLEAVQRQWKAMARTTANLVELAPESSAAFWFLDSVANYNLQSLDRAESSAERGLRLDQSHRLPQLEYLYGVILGARRNYGVAVQHIKTYLQLSPRAEDARDAQRRLAEFEKLASTQAAQMAGEQ
jgi:tetratricopeptide (TPR) repeat protein